MLYGNLSFAVDVKVNGLHICVCLEYLMSLADFFTKGLPKSKEDEFAPSKPAKSSATAAPGKKHYSMSRLYMFVPDYQ